MSEHMSPHLLGLWRVATALRMPKFKAGQRVWDSVHKKMVILGECQWMGKGWFYDVGTQTGARVEDWVSEACLRRRGGKGR